MTGGSGAQCPDYPAGSAGVLAMLAEPELRAELDRVAAAAGVRVVHA
ncbi:helicase, partial [Mycobacterium avium subsp. hominissuis]|nr:helicase [Mycobacterium avium subsp. hominissuis]MBZ4576464.1 helicase [Mycobacterium avium subsp. hominissuis]